MTCRFCEIINNGGDYPVWENERFLALLNIKTSIPGTIMIIPKQHVDYVFDLPEDLYQELFQVARMLAPKLKSAMEAVKIGILSSGFEIPHTHLFLIPLKTDFNKSPPRRFLEQKELEHLQEHISQHIQTIS